MVSFQANKREPIYRWFKYKEGFASRLVRYFIESYAGRPGRLLDPFAGAGTALFTAREQGWASDGIELLPVGALAIQAREAFERIEPRDLFDAFSDLRKKLPTLRSKREHFLHITITKDAFPPETEAKLNGYIEYVQKVGDETLRNILRFIGLTILEEISYTRKDGQYLRWDHRSKRNLTGRVFDKGRIYSFDEALLAKLSQIEEDFDSVNDGRPFPRPLIARDEEPTVQLKIGSCLEKMSEYDDNSFDLVVTSPPYCNRYDYTRTYALELVYLECSDADVRSLRQELLSCTVENREKVGHLRLLYESDSRIGMFDDAMAVYRASDAMSEVNEVLERLRDENVLNNKNIARMVRNYFLEMCFVIGELSRVIKPGGTCIMVNDNVRYGGEEIPVDLILSEFAEAFGFHAERILVLPRGKGNSSQQMGIYGRTEIRKCVYIWKMK